MTTSSPSKSSSKRIKLTVQAEPCPSVMSRPLVIDDPSWVEKREHLPPLRLSKPQKESRKAHQHLLVGEGERVIFQAANFGENSQAAREYRYAVAVIDEEAQSLRLWDAELFVGKRQVKALAEQDQAKGLLEAPSAKSISASAKYYAAKTALGEAFGTRKTKQAIHSAEKNTIDLEQLKQSASSFINRTIDDTISRIATPLDSNASLVEDQSLINYELLPPVNLKAPRLSEIYPLEGVVPAAVLAAMPIEDLPERTDANGWIACARQWNMSPLIADRLRQPGLGEQSARLLLLLHWLLLFRQQREATLNDSTGLQEALGGPPAILLEWLLEQFTQAGNVVFRGKPCRRLLLPSSHKDRLLNWICILSLHLDEYRTNATVLSCLLQVTLVKIVDHFRAVGATIERPRQGESLHYTSPHGGRQLQVKYAQLTLPPVFPKPRRMKAQ